MYKLSDDDGPLDVAVQSGRLWVSYYDQHQGSGAIGSFSLSVADPAMEANPATGGWYDAPLIAADPTDTGNELVAADPGEDPASLASYDTASDPATVGCKASSAAERRLRRLRQRPGHRGDSGRIAVHLGVR